jgi:hypothetical protein
MYTRAARAYKFEVTAGTEISSTGVTLASVTGLYPKAILHNPRNLTSCRVEAISTLTATGSSASSTTFSCEVGDILVLGAGAEAEGSTAAPVVNGTDDQNFNTLQFSRLSVSISWVLDQIKQLAGGNRLTREKMYLVQEFLNDCERTWLLGDYTASSSTKNTTTGVQTGYATEYPTTRGLFKLAANSASAEGSGNLSWLRKSLPIAMGEQTNDNDMYIALCSNEYYGRVLDEMNEKLALDRDGELKQYGIKSNKIVTAGPNIELMKHNTMNVPGLNNKLLVFAPKNLGYVHLEGHDVGPNNGIQDNATHGKQDEIYAYHGIETLDAGKTITVVSNLF